MPLSENITSRMPKAAARVVAASLEAIVPTVDIDPKKADEIRKRVEAVLADIVSKTKAGSFGVVSNNALSGGLREAAEGERDEEISSTLNGVAQSIACLTGQKSGGKYEPRAFRPRPGGEEI